jgi:hypothetical protein
MSSLQVIGERHASVQEFWRRFEDTAFNSIRGVISNALVRQVCADAKFAFRQRKLTPVLTILHMLMAGIWPEASFAASWQALWSSACALDPVLSAVKQPRSGSLAKARQRIPMQVWNALCAAVSALACACGAARDTWRGLRLVLMDGTCVSMPAEDALFEHYGSNGQARSCGKPRYPLARMVVLGLARSRAILAYAVGVYIDSETSLARTLLKHLRVGDLLIADRLFAAAHAYAMYAKHQIQFITRMHQRVKLAKLRKLEIFAPGDMLVEMPVNAAYRRAHPETPEKVIVRVIRARISGRDGNTWLHVVTSLLNPADYPAEEIVALYAQRWRIETLFREFKIDLSGDVLRSKTPDGIAKEIAARVTALNTIRVLMQNAAVQEDADVLRISFVQTLRTVLNFAPGFATQRPERLPQLYRRMLEEIARQRVPERPGRQEPRKIRRETKHYPTLRVTRVQWRKKRAA